MNFDFNGIQVLIADIFKNPVASLFVIGNLIIIESLLSVDNAAVLATMVMDLPAKQRKKALSYGIIGAYLFRGLSLIFASFLVRIWWLKPIGGIYLLFLVYKWCKEKYTIKKSKKNPEDSNWLYKATVGKIGVLWASILSIELMDLAFSIDNVFAAVAFSKNIVLIICGVFIGILAMRFVAQIFVKLMEKYTFLEGCAYLVIGLLGIKLSISVITHFSPESALSLFLESNTADVATSLGTLIIFILPFLSSILFNFPRQK